MKDYDEKVEGIIGIIDDGIKDSCMQCDWAHEARDSGDREAAMMFHTEAHKRLTSAKEWLEKHKEMLLDPHNAEDVAEVFVKRLEDRIAHAMAKVTGFKP